MAEGNVKAANQDKVADQDHAAWRKWANRPTPLKHLSFAEYMGYRETAASPSAAVLPSGSARPRHEAGKMNKTEARYAEHLETRKMVGEIRLYRFEPMKLRLAPSTFFDVDFLVWMADGSIELHEVKGHWEDDARVKIKVAAKDFPWWTFVGVMWHKTEKFWKYEEFKRGA